MKFLTSRNFLGAQIRRPFRNARKTPSPFQLSTWSSLTERFSARCFTKTWLASGSTGFDCQTTQRFWTGIWRFQKTKQLVKWKKNHSQKKKGKKQILGYTNLKSNTFQKLKKQSERNFFLNSERNFKRRTNYLQSRQSQLKRTQMHQHQSPFLQVDLNKKKC